MVSHVPNDALIQEAAHWFACQRSGAFGDRQRQAWQKWLRTSPAHRQAWQRVQEVCARFDRVRGPAAMPVLAPANASRRRVLRGLAWLAGGLLLAGGSAREETGSSFRTAVGEQRAWHLADGSLLALNTQSAARLSADGTQVQLLAGELFLQTVGAGRPPPRIWTRDGLVTPLGTRFIVRLEEDGTRIQVLSHAVRISPWQGTGEPCILTAGHQTRFNTRGVEPEQPLDPGAGLWLERRLSVIDMPLPQWLAELGRYRAGHLGYAPELADLRVSGVYPLDDTDIALDLLAAGQGLRIERWTRYWVRVLPG